MFVSKLGGLCGWFYEASRKPGTRLAHTDINDVHVQPLRNWAMAKKRLESAISEMNAAASDKMTPVTELTFGNVGI